MPPAKRGGNCQNDQTKNMKTISRIRPLVARPLALIIFALLPTLAQAHPGEPGHAHGFTNGLLHPLTGLEHICAMIAVGLWAAQLGGRARWLVPTMFVAAMMLGGVLGLSGRHVPGIEQGIAASVLILGVFIATATKLPLSASAAIVALFAWFHGYAHGAEMPANTSAAAYGTGFIFATAGLHILGVVLGVMAQEINFPKSVRVAGASIAACGVYLCFA